MKELNIAKGFAMLGILYIHLISILRQPSAEVHFKYQSFNLSSICGFVLPMFFVIAGFTYSKTKKTIKNELQQRVLQLLKYFTKYFIVIGAIYPQSADSFTEVQEKELKKAVGEWTKAYPAFKRITKVEIRRIPFEKTTTMKIKRNKEG